MPAIEPAGMLLGNVAPIESDQPLGFGLAQRHQAGQLAGNLGPPIGRTGADGPRREPP